MPDDALAGQVTALQVSQAKTETALDFLKRDTEAIRQSQHGVNNELQKLVASEGRMVIQMEALAKAQTEAQAATAKLADSVAVLNNTNHEISGGWQMAARIGVIVGAIITITGTALAAVAHVVGVIR